MARVVVLDACVLYSAPLRDLLIRLSSAGVIRGRWSATILDECFRSILANRPDLSPAALTRTRSLMIDAVPDCLITGFENLIPELILPDVDDRHVLAAAIHGGADTIATLNLADFPRAALAPHGIKALSPDELLVALLQTSAAAVGQIVTDQAAALKRPLRTVRDLLEIFKAQGLARAVPKLAELLNVIPGRPLDDRPLLTLSEIERHAAWDQISRPLDEGILEEARADAPHSRELAVSIAILTRRDGEQRFAGAVAEHGDDEGRRFIGGLVRAYRQCWLESRERLTRRLLRARIDSDAYTLSDDPLRASSVCPTAEEVCSEGKSVPWELDVARRDSEFNAREVRVSVAVLTRADELRRFTFNKVELGDGEARTEVGAFVRIARRTGLLRRTETLERYSLRASLGSSRYDLIADPVAATRTKSVTRTP